MAVLERSILRLAVWELSAGEVPAGVAIDEAVTLAKRYASPEAGGARERDPGPGGPRAGGGEVDEPRLEQLAADLEALGARLESGDLDADEATALLEQMTALVHEAVDVLEQAGEALESRRGRRPDRDYGRLGRDERPEISQLDPRPAGRAGAAVAVARTRHHRDVVRAGRCWPTTTVSWERRRAWYQPLLGER